MTIPVLRGWRASSATGTGGSSMSRASVAVLAVCAVLAAASLLPAAGSAGSGSLTIVAELPLAQTTDPEPQGILNAVQMAVQATGSACGLPVTVATQNYSTATAFADPTLLSANAAASAADPSVVGIVGPYDSASAALLIGGVQSSHLAVVSPSSTDPTLTKPPAPNALYPDGFRDFARVITTDDVEGGEGATLAIALGAHSAYVVSDGSAYGATVTGGFLSRAAALGLPVLGTATPTATALGKTVAKIRKLSPDLVYYGGEASRGSTLLVDLRRAHFKGLFVGGAGILTPGFLDSAGTAAEGAYATRPGLSAASIPSAATWAASYAARFGAPPGFYAPNAYAATQVLLAAINTVCAEPGGDPFNRTAVTSAVMATQNLPTLLGRTTFDANGDGDTLDLGTSVYRVMSGTFTLT